MARILLVEDEDSIGEVIELNLTLAGHSVVRVSSAEAAQGSEVQVTVSIANNPGIAMLEMPVSYDDTRLA